MKVLQINGGVFGSTGKIMGGIKALAANTDIEVFCASPITKANKKSQPEYPYIKIGNYYSRIFNVALDRLTGFQNFHSFITTKLFLKKVKKLKPDIIHLHNLHESYINIKLLFDYIKKNNIKVVWTLHDCWSFTGHCPHFIYEKCDKWISGCSNCPTYKSYPKSYIDNSGFTYEYKKKCFCGVRNMTIVTPSKWLAELVKRSFLNEYPVKVINNGIDTDVFKFTVSDFRKKYNLKDKFIILGVSYGWSLKKGLDVFIELSKRLNDDFKIVLVGTDDSTDKLLPENILSVHNTNSQSELACIYSCADVLINPTREDNYPTVNLESISCGTPVLTFDTGGSSEMIDKETGVAIPCDDIDGLLNEINGIYKNRRFSRDAIQKKSAEFDQKTKLISYIDLYKNI